jgi:hypothetical protein
MYTDASVCMSTPWITTLSLAPRQTEYSSNHEGKTKTAKSNEGKSIYESVESARSIIVDDNAWGLG